MGAAAGGFLGHQAGGGLATGALGAIGGAFAGNKLENK